MSSFKRRGASSTVQPPLGARQSSSSPTVANVSSGVPSLDDVLGGGFPLGSIVTVLTPDLHSAWGTLIQRYFIAQGLIGSQAVCVVSNDAKSLADGCMWTSGPTEGAVTGLQDDHPPNVEQDTQIKIAWRYEKMRQFQTTVPSASFSDDFCDVFDLTKRVPPSIILEAIESGKLSSIDIPDTDEPFATVLQKIREVIQEGGFKQDADGVPSGSRRRALRLSIPDLGGPAWGDPSPQDILKFIYSLRTIVRSADVSVLVTLPPHLSSDDPSFTTSTQLRDGATEHWLQKIGFLCDGCLSLASFGADPTLSTLFQTYHGAIRVIRAPSPHSLIAPSQKHSVLRGLNGPSGQQGGENNLAFRCTRKRFVVETLHLDVEGGVGERRTSAAPSAAVDVTHVHHHPDPIDTPTVVEVEVDSELLDTAPTKPGRTRKKVMFQADRPDLYDF